MGDELAQLDVGDLALSDLACKVDVFQHVIQAGISRLDTGQRLVQGVAHVMVSFIEKEFVARLRRHPEGAFLFVPA
ncbi:hypothetical protein D3C77_272280 [compost metagenome]